MTLLQTGQNIPLSTNGLLKDLLVGFGWKVVQGNGPKTELVPSAIVCDEHDKAISQEHLIFFNQMQTPEGSVQYIEGDDEEQIEIDLAKIPEKAHKIFFVVYTDPDIRRPGNFGAVRDAYIRVAGRDNADIARYNIEQGGVNNEYTAIIFGELYRYKGAWKFRALGQGFKDGLAGVAKAFEVKI